MKNLTLIHAALFLAIFFVKQPPGHAQIDALLFVCETLSPGQDCSTEQPCVPVQEITVCPDDEICFLIIFVVQQYFLTYTITIGQSNGPNIVYVETTNSTLYIRFSVPALPSGSTTTFTLLSMTDSAGGTYDVSDSLPVVITMADEPTNLIISQSGQACFNNPVTLTASSGGGPATYTWSNGVTGASTTVFSSGQYTVTATLGNGCSATATTTVNYEPEGPVSITVNGPVCAGQTFVATANPANGATFLWSNGATGQSTTFIPPVIFSVTATASNGCTGTASLNFSSPSPPPTVSIVGPSTICPNQTVNLSASDSFETYNWSTGSQSPAIAVSSAGTYNLTVTNIFGCTGSATQTVSAAPLPTVSYSGPPTVCEGGCQDFSVIFTGKPPFSLTYTVGSGGPQTATFSANTGILQICPPAGTPPGQVTLSAVSLTDANCVCE